MVTIDDFAQLEIIIAEIKEAQDHPDADRLFVLKIDTGSELKQLIAGIRTSYSAQELVGKQIAVINNLQPATIRGQESQGMLLAASSEDGPVLLSPEKKVPLGARVK